MLKKLKRLYHDAASVAILSRMFLADALCPNCEWNEEAGMEIRCPKHHEKQFMREIRADEHFIRSLR